MAVGASSHNRRWGEVIDGNVEYAPQLGVGGPSMSHKWRSEEVPPMASLTELGGM